MGEMTNGSYINEHSFDTSTSVDRSINQMQYSININTVNPYVFMNHTYEGSSGYRDGSYLIPFSRESSYQSRKQLAHFKNYLKPILRAMVAPVFAETAPRKILDGTGTETTDSLFAAFIKDCDGAGTHLQEYTAQAMSVMRRHGVCFTVMDNFPTTLQPQTMAQAVAGRIFPYIYLKQAHEVVEHECDQFGNLREIMFTDAPVEVNGKYEKRYRKWTTTESLLYGKDAKGQYYVIDRATHNLGIVPVIMVFAEPRECKSEILPTPPLYDIAKLNYVIFNQCAEVRDQERAQAFSIFFCQGVPPSDLVISNNTYINLPDSATISPGYASPDWNIIAGLVANQEQNRKDLFTIAEQNGVVGVQSASSGVAMAWDFAAHENILRQTSSLAMQLENFVAKMFMRYTNDAFVYTVEYPMDFAPMGLDNEVGRLDKVLRMPGLNPLLIAAIQEKLTRLLLREEDPDTIKRIVDAIEKAASIIETVDTESTSNSVVIDAPQPDTEEGSTEESVETD
jgi:hypothetical protein